MESSVNFPEMLEQLHCPAFIVENGIVVMANQGAIQRQIAIGSAVCDYISLGAEEYREFSQGKLCLTLRVCDVNYDACVVCNEQLHIFYLDSDYQEPELRAFALAAQHLREPLANAMTCANYLLPESSSEEMQNQLAQLNKNLHQLHRAICNMSDTANYEKSHSACLAYQEIRSLFEEVMEKAATYIAKGEHTLTYTNLASPVFTKVDAEKLERALLNMLSNAVKFAPKGSEIHATIRQSGKKLYFCIENINTNSNQTANIFANYLREPGIEHPQTGIGLGMAIVRKSAALHGGTVLMELLEDAKIRLTMTIAVSAAQGDTLRSPVRMPVDYAGGYDHALTELSDILTTELYN